MIVDQLSSNTIIESQPSLNELKLAAHEFLAVIDFYQIQLNNFSALLKKQYDIRAQYGKSNVKNIDEYIANKSEIRSFLISEIPEKIYTAMFKFQKTLNAFLGQNVVMVLVFDNGSGPELYQMTSADVLSYDYSSAGALTARYRNINENTKQSLKKIEIDETLTKFSLVGLKTTRAEVIQRYTCAKQKSSGYRYVLWQSGDKWYKMKVTSLGDIEEAYAVFIFANKEDPSFAKDIESNVEDFLLRGVNMVDNVSGLLSGDTSLQNLEIGIKSLSASTLGMQQVKDLALQVIKENFTEESLQKIKDKLEASGRMRNQSKQFVRSKIDKELIQDILANRGK